MSPSEAWPGSRDYFKCWQKVAISRKRHKIATWLQRETIRKSYAAYRTVILPMPLSDPYPPSDLFWYIKAPFVSLARVLQHRYTYWPWRVLVNRWHAVPKWGVAGVTWPPEILAKSGNISKTLQNSDMANGWLLNGPISYFICGLSNGDIADHLEWPWKLQNRYRLNLMNC